MDGPTTVDLRDLRAKLRAAHPYKDTLQAAERVIDAEHRFLEGNVPVSSRLWQEVVMLLVARVLQLQRAVVDAVTIGYDEEVQPIARATASAVVTMTAIGHGNRLVDRDRKAVRYIAFADRARRRQARYLAQSRWISRQARLASDAEAQAETKDLLDRAAKDGITRRRRTDSPVDWCTSRSNTRRRTRSRLGHISDHRGSCCSQLPSSVFSRSCRSTSATGSAGEPNS